MRMTDSVLLILFIFLFSVYMFLNVVWDGNGVFFIFLVNFNECVLFGCKISY